MSPESPQSGGTRRQFLRQSGSVLCALAVAPGRGSAQGADRRRWSYDTGQPVFSSPTVVDGIVYVGSQSDRVYALDAATGERRWEFETEGTVDGSPLVVDAAFGADRSPARTVVVGSSDTTL